MSLLKHKFVLFFVVMVLGLPAFAEVVIVSGILEPLEDADISASVAGKIEAIHYREGQSVDKDTVVIQLMDKLELLEVDRRQVTFDSKAELEAATARMETIKADLDSTQALFETTGSISQEELNNKELEYKLAIAERDREENEEIREGIELQMSKFQLQQRAVKAPFSGKVADVYLDKGEDCSPGEALFRLVDLSQCYFTCNVEAGPAACLEKGQTVDLEIDTGFNSVSRKGKIAFIGPTIDAASGLRKIKVLIDNADFSLTPGATGKLTIKIDPIVQ